MISVKDEATKKSNFAQLQVSFSLLNIFDFFGEPQQKNATGGLRRPRKSVGEKLSARLACVLVTLCAAGRPVDRVGGVIGNHSAA